MNWLFGSKKKKPVDKYQIKLDQLEKLGYKDRTKNLELLKMYGGDVNLVIQDYTVQQPSSQSISPPKDPKPKKSPKQVPMSAPKQSPKQQPKPAPKQSPKQQSQAAPKPASKQSPKQSPKQPPKPSPKPEPKSAPKQSPKQEPKPVQKAPPQSEEKQSPKPVPPQSAKPPPAAQPVQKDSNRGVKPISKKFPKATMPKATLKTSAQPQTDAKPTAKPQPPLTSNLRALIASDIRQILINIGEPMIGEIVLSNSISGDAFYEYSVVNPLLQKFNVSFGDQSSYQSLLRQCELSYQKSGATDVHNPIQKEETKAEPTQEEKKQGTTAIDYEGLKQNIANLVSSDVRLLLLPLNAELAERLYAFSVSGSDFYRLDYDGIVFVSGMKDLKKADWNQIAKELKLPQTEPFDATQWNQLQKDQEALIEKAQNMEKQIKALKQNMSQKPEAPSQPTKQKPKPKPKPKQEEKQNKSDSKKTEKMQKKQLQRMAQMDKEADKFLPTNVQKLKQRQLGVLTTLHDIASIINVDATTVTNIENSARRESERELSLYLKSGKAPPQSAQKASQPQEEKKSDAIRSEDLERRQLKLLSTIHATRNRLEALAKSKGVSVDTLNNITSKVDTAAESKGSQDKIAAADVASLNKQFDSLFQNLAQIAISVQETAKQYGVRLEDDKEMKQCIIPMYTDLEKKQNALVARIQYLNDQARMINPKAVEVHEEILHISGVAHRRTSSGPAHLAVPCSPGESPTPHDHFPDTTESKDDYDQASEHPSGLPQRRASRSPSLSPGILITAPDETEREANQVRERRKSLQVNASLLESTLKDFDKNNDGYLNRKSFGAALRKISIPLNVKDANVKIVLKDVTEDGKGINIEKLIHFVCDPRTSLKLDSCKQWNSFRMKIISAKRKD